MKKKEDIYQDILGGLGIGSDKKKLILIAMDQYKEQELLSYPQAWKTYEESKEYAYSHRILIDKGMKDPYAENLLRNAFNAGWNSK